jgi:hypothetical protein
MSPYVVLYLVENSSKIQIKRFNEYNSCDLEGRTHIIAVYLYRYAGYNRTYDKTHDFNLEVDEHLTRSFFPLPLTTEHFKCLNFYNSRQIQRIQDLE